MPLVFSAITSHTPLLMPNIGKKAGSDALQKTTEGMQHIEKDLYISHPDTILIISPHGNELADSLVLNYGDKFATDFKEFGDLVTRTEFRPDTMLIDRIREDFKAKHLPLTLESAPELDYGMGVPLHFLTSHLKEPRIVPVHTCQLDMKTHYDIGKEMKDELMSYTKRIAVIASADLSHRLAEKAPGGFSQKGVEFDERIKQIIESGRLVDILDIDDGWVTEAQACGAKVLAMLFGILDEVRTVPKVISYENPFGVGYMIADMKVG